MLPSEYAKPIKLGTGLVAYKYTYFLDKEHPLASKPDGIVLFHRHVASITLGYWLSSDEHVHHIDENKLNNSSENLAVMTAEEHGKIHKPVFTEVRYCKHCNTEMCVPIDSTTMYCSNTCRSSSGIKDSSLTKEYLESILPTHSWTSLGKLTGYSDNGIKKRAKVLGCDLTLIRSAKNKVGLKH